MAVIVVVLGAIYPLAVRNSRWLGIVVAAVWIYGPLVRRLVDWQTGGYVPRTALSLLPMMATLLLVVPAFPRWRYVPTALRQAMLLVALPILYAAAIGFVWYGPSAVFEAGDWFVPMLFVPYYATRLEDIGRPRQDTPWIVSLAALSGVYAVFQFLTLPPWDYLWLTKCGLSSFGQAAPGQFRAWGTMNAYGPAARVWALATLVALTWPWKPTSWRAMRTTALAPALLISLNRTSWLMLGIGAFAYLICASQKRSGMIVGGMLLAAMSVPIAASLPGGNRVLDRLTTFNDLESDSSFKGRTSIIVTVAGEVAESPLGKGIGYKTADRVAGTSGEIGVIDNGFGELFLTLGVPGSLVWCFGIGTLAHYLSRKESRVTRAGPTDRTIGLTLLAMTFVALVSNFSFGGIVGAMAWCLIGASSVAPTLKQAPTTTAAAWVPAQASC